MSTFISTYTGRRFYPLDPNPADVCIDDIAHALARITRFNGHINAEWYSVAEHSVHVSRIVPPEYALAGLLHDASEAYIADVSRPVKHTEEMREYRIIEGCIQQIIDEKYEVDGPPRTFTSWEPLALADAQMLSLEARSLLPYDPWMDELPEPAKVELGLWGPSEAKAAFLARYRELTE